MSFGAQLIARVLGLPDIPMRAVRRTIGLFLLAMAIAMPVTFRHGIELYANQESQRIVKQWLNPMLARLQNQVDHSNTPTTIDRSAKRTTQSDHQARRRCRHVTPDTC